MKNKIKLAYFLGEKAKPSETFISKEIEAFREYGADIDIYTLSDRKRLSYHLSISKFTDIGYDAVIAHFFGAPAKEAYKHVKNNDIPFIVSCHAEDIYVNTLSENMQEDIFKRADGIITCCEGNLKYLQENFPDFRDKMQLFYHGVKIENSMQPGHNFLKDDKIRLLFVGRLVEKKGLIEFLNFLGKARENFTRKVEFTIIGDGKKKQEVIKAISDNKLNDMVNVIPFMPQSELVRHYTSSDIFVFPSIITENGDRDGLANVILESFSCGLPVMATAVNGTVDVIKDSNTGFIMDYKKAHNIVDIINNSTAAEFELVAKNAFFLVKKFEHNAKTRELYEYITTLL